MMFDEHAVVIVTRDLPDARLDKGAIGTIVHVYPDGAAYEIEFDVIPGKSMPLATLQPGDFRLATAHEVAVADQLTQAAK